MLIGRKKPPWTGVSFGAGSAGLVHATHVRNGGRSWFLGDVDDESAHGNSGSSDAGCALDGFFRDFRWVDDAGFFQVDEAFFWFHDVNSLARLRLFDFGEESLRVETSVFHNVNEGSLEGLLDNFCAIAVGFEAGGEIDESDATAGDDTFGESGFRGSNSVVDAELFLVDFGFGSATDFDDGDFAEEGGSTLLELFAGVVGFFELGLGLDEVDAVGNGFLVAGTFDDGGFVFGGDNLAASTENFHADFFKFHAFVAGNDGGIGQDGDVFHDFFAAVAEGRSLKDESIEDALQFVEDENGEGFARDFFSDNGEVFATGLSALFEERNEFLGTADFLVSDKDERFVEDGFLAVGVSDEERRGEAFVVGETFDDFLFHFEALALFDGDDAVFADFADDICDKFADFFVASGDGGNFGNFFVVTLDFFGGFFDAFDDFGASLFNSLAELHWVHASGDEFVGFAQDVISKDGDGCGTIAGNFVELLGGGFDEFRADLFAEVVFGAAEVDGFSDGDAIVGDGGGAVGFFDDDVLTLRTEGDFDGVVELFSTGEDFVAGFGGVENLFCHFGSSLFNKLERGEDVFFVQDDVASVFDFDVGRGVVFVDDFVAFFDGFDIRADGFDDGISGSFFGFPE